MHKKKNSSTEAKPPAVKHTPTPAKPPAKPKSKPPMPMAPPQPTPEAPVLTKLEKGKANLKRLLKKIEQGDNPYASDEPREQFTTHNVSSAYTTSLENINTKEQTFATIEENRHEYEMKNIWAEEFEEKRPIVKTARKEKYDKIEKARLRNNRSCSDRFESRKSLNKIVRSAFNSLDSCKGAEKGNCVKPIKPVKKVTKKPKKPRQQQIRTAVASPSLLSPRPLLASPRVFASPRSSMSPHNPKPSRTSPNKKRLEVPSSDFLNQLAQQQQHSSSQHQKITEVSDQQLQCSIVKSKTLKNNSWKKGSLKINPIMRKNKAEAMRSLREQIRGKVSSQYPTLEEKERKLLCAVILIQRLWRQSKVKNIIGQFLTPRKMGAAMFKSQQEQVREEKVPSLPGTPRVLTVLTPPAILPTKQQLLLITPTKPRNPIESPSPQPLLPKPPSLPLSPLLSSDSIPSISSSSSNPLSPRQQSSLLKFVDSYRDMFLDSSGKKKRNKPNIFSLSTSLSDKCLMEKFYKKVNKMQPTENEESRKIHSKLVIKKSQKERDKIDGNKAELCTVLSTERFYTEVKEDLKEDLRQNKDLITESPPNIQQTQSQSSPLTSPAPNIIINSSPHQKREIVSNFLVQMLIDQFLQQFVRDSKKHKLKSKKKKLPGLKISKTSIQKYLDGLIEFVLEYYKQEVLLNLNKIIGVEPRMLLKYLRDDFEEDGEEDDEYCKGPVLSKDVFFQYQAYFEKQCFKPDKQQQKYINIIQGFLKIHNKSLLDSFTETLDTVRIYGIKGKPYPWQPPCSAIRKIDQNSLMVRLHTAKKMVEDFAGYRLGNLDKRSPHYVVIEEQNLLYSLREDFARDQHEWDMCSEEKLELGLEMAEWVWERMVLEAIQEIVKK